MNPRNQPHTPKHTRETRDTTNTTRNPTRGNIQEKQKRQHSTKKSHSNIYHTLRDAKATERTDLQLRNWDNGNPRAPARGRYATPAVQGARSPQTKTKIEICKQQHPHASLGKISAQRPDVREIQKHSRRQQRQRTNRQNIPRRKENFCFAKQTNKMTKS